MRSSPKRAGQDFLDLRIPTTQTIHYVNALPGTGKTHEFLHTMVKSHFANPDSDVLIYAAPTNLLLEEVEAELKRLYPKQYSRKLIQGISSDDGDGRVADKLHAALSGTETLRPVPKYTILLVSHECIARAGDFPNKARVSLVYDEARACLQDNYRIKLTQPVYDFLTQPEPGKNMGRVKDVTITLPGRSPIRLWTFNTAEGYTPVTEEELVPLLKKSTQTRRVARRIVDMMDNVESPAIDVHVDIQKMTKNGETEYVVNNVHNPARMFHGYRRVLIMSAFFESSQMFHFLKIGSFLSEFKKMEIRDVTHKVIDPRRVAAIVNRLRATYITFVVDSDSELNKTQLVDGIAVATKANLEKWNTTWKSLFDGRSETYRAVLAKYEASKSSNRFTLKNRSKPFEWFSQNPYVFGSAIKYSTSMASRLFDAFLTKAGQSAPYLPIGVPPYYRAVGGATDSGVWESEELSKIGPIKLEQLRMVSHGLNKYSAIPGAAFIASMKYAPGEFAFFQGLIPEYDAAVDRTVDYAVQLLWRCNMRNANSKSKNLLILTDSVMAREFRKRVLAYPSPHMAHRPDELLRIIHPKKLLPEWENAKIALYTEEIDPEAKREANKSYRASAEGEINKRIRNEWANVTKYNSLGVQINRFKETDPEKAAKLRKARSEIIALRDWKKTPAGITCTMRVTDEVHREWSTR